MYGLHQVCEVNNAGVIVKSYGGSRGNKLKHLNWPAHVALDSEKRVFVADSGNDRVLLLDKQLNIQRVLLTWSRDRRPCRLFCDGGRETTQLIVGLDSGQVEVFRLL
jgi:DNA-binding beta-propeller fold protein YncE